MAEGQQQLLDAVNDAAVPLAPATGAILSAMTLRLLRLCAPSPRPCPL